MSHELIASVEQFVPINLADGTIAPQDIVVVGCGAAIVLFIAMYVLGGRKAKEQPPKSKAEGLARNHEVKRRAEGPTGVGGWLLLLCIGLVFIGPILGTARQLERIPSELQWIIWVDFWFSIITGILLWIGRREGVRLAQIRCWLVIAFSILAVIQRIDHPLPASDTTILEALFSSFWSAIWLLYFAYSVRVRNTYFSPKQKLAGSGSAIPIVPPENFDEQIRKLAKLHDDGLITDQDFIAKKNQILGLD